jgi:hypothetical protein
VATRRRVHVDQVRGGANGPAGRADYCSQGSSLCQPVGRTPGMRT